MRALRSAIFTMGTVLCLSCAAAAQQQDRSGAGSAPDTLTRTVNPDQDRAAQRARSGPSEHDGGNAQSYTRYSDQDLREESRRLDDEARQIDRRRQAVEDEMSRRRSRR